MNIKNKKPAKIIEVSDSMFRQAVSNMVNRGDLNVEQGNDIYLNLEKKNDK